MGFAEQIWRSIERLDLIYKKILNNWWLPIEKKLGENDGKIADYQHVVAEIFWIDLQKIIASAMPIFIAISDTQNWLKFRKKNHHEYKSSKNLTVQSYYILQSTEL